jgi:hypothetical protein
LISLITEISRTYTRLNGIVLQNRRITRYEIFFLILLFLFNTAKNQLEVKKKEPRSRNNQRRVSYDLIVFQVLNSKKVLISQHQTNFQFSFLI